MFNEFSNGEPEVHAPHDTQGPNDLRFADPLIAEIRTMWIHRRGFHKAEKALTLQAKAMCRSFCGGDKKEADALFKAALAGEAEPVVLGFVLPFIGARKVMEDARKLKEKSLINAAKRLPIYPWVKEVKGLGELGLAAIVGEAGDLSCYRTVSGVWKRLGVGLHNGERQRLKSGQTEEEAMLMGYNPERRSMLWTLADSLLKAQGKDEAAGPYRRIYDARKAYERPRVESDAHAHNRAMRYMSKCLLRDLTNAWRGVSQSRRDTQSSRADSAVHPS